MTHIICHVLLVCRSYNFFVVFHVNQIVVSFLLVPSHYCVDLASFPLFSRCRMVVIINQNICWKTQGTQ